LDTVEEEPPQPDAPILSAANCLITPHNSFYSANSVRLVNSQVVENILDAFRGRSTPFIVNPEVL